MRSPHSLCYHETFYCPSHALETKYCHPQPLPPFLPWTQWEHRWKLSHQSVHIPYQVHAMLKDCLMIESMKKVGTDLISRGGKSLKMHFSVEGKSSLFKMIIYWGIKLYLKFVFLALNSLLNPIFMTPKLLLNNFNWKSNFKLNICDMFSWFSEKPDLPEFLLSVLAITWDTHTHTHTSVQLASPKLWIHLCLFFLTIPNIQATGNFLKSTSNYI